MNWKTIYYTILFTLFLACDKGGDIIEFREIRKQCVDASITCNLPGWGDEFTLGNGQSLTNTPGLRRMALTGDHSLLRQELNSTAGGSIPSDLCDDHEKDGLAGRRTYGDWVVAMYHPTTYPDHFITYNRHTGCWIRWELNDGNPIKFRESMGS